MTVTAVLNVHGEEPWLAQCLACLAWTDELVVTDMGAPPEVLELCRAAGARVVPVPRSPTVEPAREAGVAAATSEWVLVVDPDELVGPALAARLLDVAAQDEADVVIMSWRNFLLGAELRHSGWGMHPDRHARFFRKGSLRFSTAIHAVPEPMGRVLILDAVEDLAVVHLSYTDTSSFLRKLDRYTTVEARQLGQAAPVPARVAVRRALAELWRRYVTYRGFRDGWRGLVLSCLQAGYVLVTWAKHQELAEHGGLEGIERAYAEVAEQVVTEHRHRGLREPGD